MNSETISRMDGLNEELRRLTQTRIGDGRLLELSRVAAEPLGRKGLDELRSEVTPESSLYDAYNHLTFVSQRKSLGPRRELEMIAGGILTAKLSHGNQLLRKAGLNLAERSSGKYKGQIKLTKRGNSRLRKHLYFTVFHLLSYNRAFQALHAHNIEVKRMTKMQSMMKLIGKLARMLVAMARKGEKFNIDKAQFPLAAKQSNRSPDT